jgi:GNAT superfamily N-acetyltransferase
MTPEHLHRADADTLAQLTELCLCSKAHWGYAPETMAKWHDDLRVTADTLRMGPLAVLRHEDRLVGMVQVIADDTHAELERLFVAPTHLRQGFGTVLLHWAVDAARANGVATLVIESEPAAEGFYRRLGATRIGTRASTTVPGRHLPLLRLTL